MPKDSAKFTKDMSKYNRFKDENGKQLWTLEQLENLQYRIDLVNVFRFGYAMRTRLVKSPKQAVARVLDRIEYRGLRYMEWKTICSMADWLEISPELLVDEDYYFKRGGLAGYRVLFAMHKQGKTLAELTFLDGHSNNPKHQYWWYASWNSFLKSAFPSERFIKVNYLHKILENCHQILGLPIGALVGKTLHTTGSEPLGVYAQISELLLCLDTRGHAFVAAVLRALWNHKQALVAPDGIEYEKFKERYLPLEQVVSELVEWYLNGRKS